MRGRESSSSPVPELLFDLCRADAASVLNEDRLRPLSSPAFRSAFAEAAQRNGVLGLVLATLDRALASRGPRPALDESLLALLPPLRRRTAIRLMERDRVLAALADRDLHPVILKGAALCTTVYRELVEREFGDIDLLLGRREIDDAVEAVLAAGYEFWLPEARQAFLAHHFHFRLVHPQGFVIELHWGLTRPRAAFRLYPESFMDECITVEGRDGAPLRVPGREHQLLHAVSQSARGGFNRFVRLVDVDRIVRASPDLDWAHVRWEAERGGLRYPLALSLQLARRLLGTPVPEATAVGLRPSRVVRFHLEVLRPESSLFWQPFLTNRDAKRLLKIWLRADARSRLRQLGNILGGRGDPLAWVWLGEQRRLARLYDVAAGLTAVVKLVGFHAVLYLRALSTAITRRGQSSRRFWQVESSR